MGASVGFGDTPRNRFRALDDVINDDPIKISKDVTIPKHTAGVVQNNIWDEFLNGGRGGYRVMVQWKFGEGHPGSIFPVLEHQIRHVG